MYVVESRSAGGRSPNATKRSPHAAAAFATALVAFVIAPSATSAQTSQSAPSHLPAPSPPQPLTSAPAQAPEPRFAKLDNGLRIAVMPDHARPLVSAQVWYRIGSVDDDPNRPGLCHLARMLVEQREPTAGNAGLTFESRTLHDACVFHWIAPQDRFTEVLECEARRMRPRTATRGDIEAAFDLATQPTESPPDLIPFADHPYARSPTRVDSALRDTTPERMNEYLGRWFVPGNAWIVLAGAIDPNAAVDAVRWEFGGIPWADTPRRAPAPALRIDTRRIEQHDARLAGVDFVWPAHGAAAVENASIDVLMHYLTNPVDGPLAQLALRLGDTLPHWGRRAWREGGIVTLSFDEVRDVDTLRDAVRAALADVAAHLPDPVAFDRARALAARDERLRRLDFKAWALSLGYAEVVGGDMRSTSAGPERVRVGGAAGFNAAARRLQEANMAELRRLRAGPLDPAPRENERLSTEPPSVTAQGGQANVTTIVSPGPGGDLAIVRTFWRQGTGEAAAVAGLMVLGSQRWSVDQYREYLTYRGIDLFPIAGPAGVGLESRGPRDALAAMLEMQRDLLTSPRVDAEVPPDVVPRLRRYVAIAQARGEREILTPPGWIGWRTDLPLPPADPALIREAVEKLPRLPPHVEIEGDVDECDVARIARRLWAGRLPGPE